MEIVRARLVVFEHRGREVLGGARDPERRLDDALQRDGIPRRQAAGSSHRCRCGICGPARQLRCAAVARLAHEMTSHASEELGADSSDVDIDVSKLGLKHPERQWPGVPKTPRPVFQVNGWNVWTDLKGAKWRVRAIEWTNPSDFGFGFGQKEPVLAKLAWGRLLNKVSRAPSA